VSLHDRRAVALFIGGAGDKKPYYLAGPYRNIAYAQAPFDRRIAQAGLTGACRSLYLGYHEVHGAAAIERLILPAIPDKATPIYIVGHSLGAWSGAHLSQRLTEWGYRVEMLVTLDPVGSGLLVRLGSRIAYRRPAPRCHCWINVRAEPGRAPDIDEALDTNHANAWALFCKPLHDGRSAADHMFESIAGRLHG
jgi:pimeloyl-ACP methyl ester carboxylesterase